MNPQQIQQEFTAIYERESDAIFRFSVLRVSGREQALDIVQEAFMRLWKSMKDGASIEKPRPFLFKVAHNLIIDWYRKKKAVSLEGLATEEGGEYEPVQETASADLEMGAEGRFLVDKLAELEPAYRQPVYLRFVEGLSPQEIGDVLGITANAASVRVNRGLEKLRAITGYVGIDK